MEEMNKHLQVFVQRTGATKELVLFRTNRANEINKEFIISLLVYFLLKFATLFLSSEFAVTLSC